MRHHTFKTNYGLDIFFTKLFVNDEKELIVKIIISRVKSDLTSYGKQISTALHDNVFYHKRNMDYHTVKIHKLKYS